MNFVMMLSSFSCGLVFFMCPGVVGNNFGIRHIVATLDFDVTAIMNIWVAHISKGLSKGYVLCILVDF